MAVKTPNQTRLDSELRNLQKRGVTLPSNPARAALTANAMHNMVKDPSERAEMRDVVKRYTVGSAIQSGNSAEIARIQNENRALSEDMGGKRATMRRTAGAGSSVGGDVYAAIPRFYDPIEYWDLSGLPWNMADEGHRHKLHKWLRLYYSTHYLIPILVDIFTRFPLVGISVQGKDRKLNDFHEDLFFNQLDYEEFLVRLGREFWIVGEAFPLASFNESLGVWEREELLLPEDITVENFQLLGTQQLKVRPPDYLKRIVQTKSPAKDYRQLEISFKELIPYVRKGEPFPISDVLLKHVANKANDWDDRGTPILLRGLRTLLHEEKLLASQDAIAERLYSPLILAKLGIMDLGDGQGPWIPGPEEIDSVRDDFDMALSSDFRLMVHHFGLEVSSVFGREQMPRLGDDFDRIERRLMQVFGVNPSLLSAGAATQPYASSALQAEFLNQILRTFQKALKDHFRQRALIVAEAQGHYDYETKGATRIKVMEEVVQLDDSGEPILDEWGEPKTEERPKLLVPELDFATLDLRDEATERQFLQTLRQMGVPISNERLMVGIDFDINDETDAYNKGLKHQTITQQRLKMETYQALVAEGLPVPPDLRAECEAVLNAAPGGPAGGPGGLPQPGGGGAGPGGAGPPGAGPPGAGPGGGPGEGIVMPPPPPGLGGPGRGPGGGLGPGGAGGTPPGGGPPSRAPMAPGPAGTVPQVSNERRPGLTYNTNVSRKETSVTNDDESDILPSDELKLASNQELVGEDDNQRIVERRSSEPTVVESDTTRKRKRYSFIDPEAEKILNDEDASEPEPEST